MQHCVVPLKMPTAAVFSCVQGTKSSLIHFKLVSAWRFQLSPLSFPDSQPKPKSVLTQGIATTLVLCPHLSSPTPSHHPRSNQRDQGRLTFPQSHFLFPQMPSSEPFQAHPALLLLPFLLTRGVVSAAQLSPHCMPSSSQVALFKPAPPQSLPQTMTYRIPVRHAWHQTASAYALATKCS